MACINAVGQNVDETELMEEVCRLRLLKKYLSAQLFKLKSKLYISRPLSFKEYEERVAPSRPVHIDSIEAYNLTLLARIYRICGIQLTEADKNFFRAELTVLSGDLYHEGFFVEINKIGKDFHVGAFHIPIAIDIKELEKQKPLKTYNDIAVFLRFLHRWLTAYFLREKQVKEFKDLCANYDLQAEVFATHDMKYVEFKVPVKDFIVTEAESLVSFCFVYNMDSLVPTNGSFVQKDMTEDDIRALLDCVDLFMGAHLPIALGNLIQKKNVKKERCAPSGTGRNEQTINHRAIGPTEEIPLVPVSEKISIHEEDKGKSSPSLDVSSITTSEVDEIDEPVKISERGRKGHPIAESTPFGLSRKFSSCKKKSEIKTVSVKKRQQSSIRGFLRARNKSEEMSLEENTPYLLRRSYRNKSNLCTENRTTLPNVTNPLRAHEVVSNSYEETPPVHFSKSKFKRNKR